MVPATSPERVELLFQNARTALQYGLRAADLPRAARVLVPDFVCDVVLQPLTALGLEPVFYDVTDALVPDWEALGRLRRDTADCRALLLVHYFGQPHALLAGQEFCRRHGLLLIEDNAHGYGGRFNGAWLGTLGDFGISSPRKLLGTPSGGVLHLEAAEGARIRVPESVSPPLRSRLRSAVARGIPGLVPMMRRIRERARDWSDPRGFADPPCTEVAVDRVSERAIATARWNLIAETRRAYWRAWAELVRPAGLVPAFAAVHGESCPWMFPAYAAGLEERNRWILRGLRSGWGVYTWPSLPDDVIERHGSALARWQRLVCFLLDRQPPSHV